MTVVAFCDQLGIPRPTWYRWKAAGTSTKGPWPTPAQDAVEADAKALAAGWDAWGHGKLAELKRVGIDDVEPGPVSDSTMYRALRRNGLCLPGPPRRHLDRGPHRPGDRRDRQAADRH